LVVIKAVERLRQRSAAYPLQELGIHKLGSFGRPPRAAEAFAYECVHCRSPAGWEVVLRVEVHAGTSLGVHGVRLPSSLR
jgi:hypothetical protein